MLDIDGTLIKNDLLTIAEQAGAHFRKTGAEYRSTCPLHGGNNPDAFAVYNGKDGKPRWKCFTSNCGTGDIFDFVMKWQGFTNFMDAYRFLDGDVKPDPQAVAQHAAERAARAIEEMEASIAKAQSVLDELRHAQTWLAYHAQLERMPDAREMWRARGIPDSWQDWWKVGYCPSFSLSHEYSSPSLTIPVFGPADENGEWPVMNVRHRLLNPPKPNDKYRPDRPGLQSSPYIANPNIGYNTDRILVVEGEIKSQVTYCHIYTTGETLQVIGIPGKTQFRAIADLVKGHDVYICFDPDADEQAEEAARMVGGKVMTMPMKIDDAFLAGCLSRRDLRLRMKAARKV